MLFKFKIGFSVLLFSPARDRKWSPRGFFVAFFRKMCVTQSKQKCFPKWVLGPDKFLKGPWASLGPTVDVWMGNKCLGISALYCEFVFIPHADEIQSKGSSTFENQVSPHYPTWIGVQETLLEKYFMNTEFHIVRCKRDWFISITFPVVVNMV